LQGGFAFGVGFFEGAAARFRDFETATAAGARRFLLGFEERKGAPPGSASRFGFFLAPAVPRFFAATQPAFLI
jgi:hypothetical protein